KSINLTAITDPAEVAEKHVLDSLAVVPVLPAGSLLDAGSGAGFPGIPAAIAKPELDVALVDSVQKKVAFLKSALAELRLPRVRAYAVRLEGNPSKEELPRVHAAVARAYAPPQEWPQVVLDRLPGSQGPTLDQVRRDQELRAMADRRDRLPRLIELLHELDHPPVGAQVIRRLTAGDEQGVVVLRLHLIDRFLDVHLLLALVAF